MPGEITMLLQTAREIQVHLMAARDKLREVDDELTGRDTHPLVWGEKGADNLTLYVAMSVHRIEGELHALHRYIQSERKSKRDDIDGGVAHQDRLGDGWSSETIGQPFEELCGALDYCGLVFVSGHRDTAMIFHTRLLEDRGQQGGRWKLEHRRGLWFVRDRGTVR